ncbi:MAG: hypothetical protein ACOY5G_04045 [Pseudomonadota bacterium]|jgi:hypothetical protein
MKKIPSTVRALPRAERKTPLGRAGRDMGEKTDGDVTRQSARALRHAPARAAILLKTDLLPFVGGMLSGLPLAWAIIDLLGVRS